MTTRALSLAALAYRVATRDLLPLLVALVALAYTLGAMLRHRLTRRPAPAVAVAPPALPPAPAAPLEPSPLAGLTVASLRTMAARRGLPSAAYRKARRADLLVLLG
jgi:hypothetical protein